MSASSDVDAETREMVGKGAIRTPKFKHEGPDSAMFIKCGMKSTKARGCMRCSDS